MLADAALSFADMFTPPFRTVLWKAVALTLALLAALWIGLQALVLHFLALPFPWLETAATILSGLGLLFGLAFLVAPATSLFAGLFLDDIADVVERTHYPADTPGRPMPLARSVATTLQFGAVVVLVNLAALPLVLALGFGILVFFLANGYLLGREYFELAAMRFHDGRTAKALRLRHGGRIFLAGLLVAALMAVPLLNLLTPLFATALLVHTHKRIAARERAPGGLLAL